MIGLNARSRTARCMRCRVYGVLSGAFNRQPRCLSKLGVYINLHGKIFPKGAIHVNFVVLSKNTMRRVFKVSAKTADSLAPPPLPPVIFRVGVTGHRPNRLDPDTSALAERLRSILEQIQTDVLACASTHNATAPVQLRLLSSLAEGVDRLAATCALDLGYRLQTPLPLPRNEYAHDFAGADSLAEFDALLARSERVFELEASPLHRDFTYRAAGHIVLRQCDLLLAVWDGEPSRGVGGTSELIDAAEEIGRPVLYVDAAAPHDIRFSSGGDVFKGVRELIRNTVGGRNAPSQDLSRYVAERWPKHIATTSHTMLRLLGEHRLTHAKTPGRDATAELESPVLERYFRWADALAVMYGERSRSAAMRMQLLALGAVLAAILILPFEERHLWLQLFSLCEVACILWLLVEAARARKSDWHARWMTYRSISERLRCLDFLGPLTESVPAPLSGGFLSGSGPAEFSTVFVEAVNREYGLPTAQVDGAFLTARRDALARMLKSQASFQHRVAHRYEAVEAALQRVGLLLFLFAVALCLLDVLRAVAPELFERMNSHGVSGVRVATAAAIVPALGAALAGLAAQGEYKRLALRAAAMSETLRGLLAELESHTSPSLRTLQALSARVADVLTSEVQDWQVLVAAKPPTLPT